MSESETLAAALVAALTDLTNVAKKNKADTGKYGYSFANIADLIADTRPVLAEHGLVALTPVHEHAEGLACTVTILHRSGERLDFGPTPFPAGKDAQSTGSWITYMRRYCLLAALGMGAEDDDGASAKAADRKPLARTNESRPQPQEPPPGKPKAQVKGDLVAFLKGKVPEGTEKDHAAQVWTDAEVKVIDGKWVAPDEVEIVMAAAKQHYDDLEAMAREELHA